MRLFFEFLFAAASRNNLTHLIPSDDSESHLLRCTPMVSPAPNFGYTPDPPKRAWWIARTDRSPVDLSDLAVRFCPRQGRVLAEPVAQAFHAELDAGKNEQIDQEADAAFTGTGKHDELVKFLAAVHP